MPKGGAADRARRLVEADGGFLDLFRSRDGKVLWVRRGWDDGTSQHHRFELVRGAIPFADGVLQFVDGVLEPRAAPREHTWNEETQSSEIGPYRQVAEAWLVSAKARMAMRPPSSAPLPLVHAGKGKGDPEPVQWMVYVERCPEIGGQACVYFGAQHAVARRIAELERSGTGKPIELWVFPR